MEDDWTPFKEAKTDENDGFDDFQPFVGGGVLKKEDKLMEKAKKQKKKKKKIKWERFNKEIFKVSEHKTRIKGDKCNDGYIITSSTGWDKGIHKWMIDCTLKMCSRQAVGIVSNWEVDTSKKRGFSHFSVGKSYFYKGDGRGYPEGVGIFKKEKGLLGKCEKIQDAESWRREKIEICLNCENWTISFKNHGNVIYMGEIDKGIKYYPAISFCGRGDVKVTILY